MDDHGQAVAVEVGKKTTTCPILKKEAAATTILTTQSEGGGGEGKGMKKHVEWDEHAIEEHDLLRGTRMKIDEPKTPFTEYDYHSDTESVSSAIGLRKGSIEDDHNSSSSLVDSVKLRQGQLNWDDITTKLQAVVDTREVGLGLTSSVSGDGGDGDVEDSESEVNKRKAEFQDARKKHYNEAEEIRRWKALHDNDDDDDDNEE